MNAYFDGYVYSNTMMNKFVVQYDKAMIAHAAKEREDFMDNEYTGQHKWKPPNREDRRGLLQTECFQEILDGVRRGNLRWSLSQVTAVQMRHKVRKPKAGGTVWALVDEDKQKRKAF